MMSSSENQPLMGKRALVSGSTRGIGRACAHEFARLGASVTLLARDPAALRVVRDELTARVVPSGGALRHDILCADFQEPEAVRSAIQAHLKSSDTYHILLNNSGGPPPGAILNAEPESFRTAFAMHLICNQFLAQALIPGMRRENYGRIINIISTSIRQPIKGLGVSNTIRGAVASWAKTLSSELAPHGITVNNVLPGATLTGRLEEFIREKARMTGVGEEAVKQAMKAEIPAGRFAEPAEIAAAAGFLATPAAGYITGISLAVDGGRTRAL